MNRQAVPEADQPRGPLRMFATVAALLLLPPFIALAIVPILLFLIPVALIGIPFIVPAMLSGSLAARTEDRQRASWRPPARPARIALTLHQR